MDPTNIKGFQILAINATSGQPVAQRRRLDGAGSWLSEPVFFWERPGAGEGSEDGEGSGARRLGTSYTWEVSFTVVSDLSTAGNASSPADFAGDLGSALASDDFANLVRLPPFTLQSTRSLAANTLLSLAALSVFSFKKISRSLIVSRYAVSEILSLF